MARIAEAKREPVEDGDVRNVPAAQARRWPVYARRPPIDAPLRARLNGRLAALNGCADPAATPRSWSSR